MGEQVVDGRHVHAQLAEEARLGVASLELDDDVGPQSQVVEQEVGEELLLADLEPDLRPDEREALAQLEEELLHVADKLAFQISLVADVGVADEVEQVRVAGRLLGLVGVGGREGGGEVRDRLAGPLAEAGLYMVDEDVAAPAVLDRCCCVPQPGVCVRKLLDQSQMLIPGQLCKRRLHNCRLVPGRREGTHVLEIAGRISTRAGEPLAKVGR